MITHEEMKRRIEENRKESAEGQTVWSTLSPSWVRVNCGQRTGPKPTLDQYDGAPVNR